MCPWVQTYKTPHITVHLRGLTMHVHAVLKFTRGTRPHGLPTKSSCPLRNYIKNEAVMENCEFSPGNWWINGVNPARNHRKLGLWNWVSERLTRMMHHELFWMVDWIGLPRRVSGWQIFTMISRPPTAGDFRIDFDNFKVFKSNVEQNNRSGAERKVATCWLATSRDQHCQQGMNVYNGQRSQRSFSTVTASTSIYRSISYSRIAIAG